MTALLEPTCIGVDDNGPCARIYNGSTDCRLCCENCRNARFANRAPAWWHCVHECEQVHQAVEASNEPS